MTKKDNDILDYIDLEDYTLEPLEESKEFKEWKKKDNNMTEEERAEYIKKTVKDCSLTQIKYFKKRKKELPEELKRMKKTQKQLNKQYEKTKTKEAKKLVNSYNNLVKQMEHDYKTIDERINKLKEYIKNV